MSGAPQLREHESQLVVESVTTVADGVVELTLLDESGGIPPWTPGAHVDLVLGDLVRQYSLCGDPLDSRRLVVAVAHADPLRRCVDTDHLVIHAHIEVKCGAQ